MSADIHHAIRPADPRTTKSRGSSRMTRVIFGSLVAGAVTALVLTLVVLPGREPGDELRLRRVVTTIQGQHRQLQGRGPPGPQPRKGQGGVGPRADDEVYLGRQVVEEERHSGLGAWPDWSRARAADAVPAAARSTASKT